MDVVLCHRDCSSFPIRRLQCGRCAVCSLVAAASRSASGTVSGFYNSAVRRRAHSICQRRGCLAVLRLATGPCQRAAAASCNGSGLFSGGRARRRINVHLPRWINHVGPFAATPLARLSLPRAGGAREDWRGRHERASALCDGEGVTYRRNTCADGKSLVTIKTSTETSMLDVPKRVSAVSRGGTNATRRIALVGCSRARNCVRADRTAAVLCPVLSRADNQDRRPVLRGVRRCCGSADRAVALFQTRTERCRWNLAVPGEGSAPKRPPARTDGYTLLWAEPTSTPCLGALQTIWVDPPTPSRPSLQSASTRCAGHIAGRPCGYVRAVRPLPKNNPGKLNTVPLRNLHAFRRRIFQDQTERTFSSSLTKGALPQSLT